MLKELIELRLTISSFTLGSFLTKAVGFLSGDFSSLRILHGSECFLAKVRSKKDYQKPWTKTKKKGVQPASFPNTLHLDEKASLPYLEQKAPCSLSLVEGFYSRQRGTAKGCQF